jgi:hypothetical protein
MAAIPIAQTGKASIALLVDLINQIVVAQGAGGLTTSSTIAQTLTALALELAAH